MGPTTRAIAMSELIFNHHSLPYESAELAKEAVPEFLNVCLMAGRLGFPVILMDQTVDKNWFRIELAPSYYWQDWYNETGRQDRLRDQIRAFRSIATRKPMFDPTDIESEIGLFDVRETTSNQAYSALRAAAWYDYPLSSFPTRHPWDQSPITVIIEKLLGQEIERRPHKIVNFHSLSFLLSIGPQLLQARNAAIQTGQTLWDQRTANYPLLEFCGKAPTQLQNWTHLTAIFNQVKQSLDILQLFAEQWQNGTIRQYSHASLQTLGLSQDVSGESASVSNHPRKKEERIFYLLNGNKEYFENHIKLSHGFRIHFFPDSRVKKVHIGYIGPHLSL
jgi:hypothetical protein